MDINSILSINDICERDAEIIANIVNDSTIFLTQCYEQLSKEDYINKILPYQIKYFKNTLIGNEDNDEIKKYIELLNKDNRTWMIFLDNINNLQPYKKLIEFILKYGFKLELCEQIEFYGKTITHKIIYKLMKHPIYIYHDKNLENTFLGGLITNTFAYVENTNEWMINVTKLSKFLGKIIKSDRFFKQSFLTWCALVFKANLNQMHIDSLTDSEIRKLSSGTFIASILSILLQLWMHKYHTLVIDYSYVSSTKCQYIWASTTKTKTNKKYNFSTRLFFLILEYIKILVGPVVDRFKVLGSIIQQLDEALIRTFEVEGLTFLEKARLYINANKEFQLMKDILKEDQQIIATKQLKQQLLVFYKSYCQIIIKQELASGMGETLYDFLDFVTYVKSRKLNNYLSKIILDIIGTTKYSNDIYLRYKFLKHMIKNLNKYAPQNLHRIFKDLIKIHYDMSNNSDLDYDRMIKAKRNIYISLLDLAELGAAEFNSQIEIYDIKKMINIIFSDLIKTTEKFRTLTNELQEAFNSEDREEFANINVSISFLIDDIVMTSVYIIQLATFFDNVKTVTLSNEMLPIIINFANPCLEICVNMITTFGKDDRLESYLILPPFELMALTQILNLFLFLDSNDTLIQLITSDTMFYKKKYYITIKKFLKILDKNAVIYNDVLLKYRTFINKIIRYKNISIQKEIPDEFLDPLVCTLMENPVLLPNTSEFIDRTTIERYLLSKEENPFNREPLTLIQLNEYNNTPEIISKTNELKNKIIEWKSSN